MVFQKWLFHLLSVNVHFITCKVQERLSIHFPCISFPLSSLFLQMCEMGVREKGRLFPLSVSEKLGKFESCISLILFVSYKPKRGNAHGIM